VSVIGEQMSAGELMEWTAYEQTFGSLLIHERIDAGFAQVSLILAQAFGDGHKRWSMRDFMPPWFQKLTEDEAMEQELAALRGMIDAYD
jgi:hypothetical protein